MISDDVERLISIGRSIKRVGLSLSIRSVREAYREELAAQALMYLNDLPKIFSDEPLIQDQSYESLEKACRMIICQELFSKRQYWRKRLISHNPPPDASFAAEDSYLDAILKEEWEPLSFTPEQLDVDPSVPKEALQFSESVRLDALLANECKLWKKIRIQLKEFFIQNVSMTPGNQRHIMGKYQLVLTL
jgi:hypothetical protein